MEDNRRQTRCVPFFAGMLLWLSVLVVAFLARRYLTNVLFGPFALDQQALSAITDIDSQEHYYVQIQPALVKPLFAYAHSGGPEPYSIYALLQVGDKTLLARLPTHYDSCIRGTLEQLSTFERNHIVSRLGRAQDFQAFRFNATRSFRTTGYLLAVLPLGSAGILATWLVVMGLRRCRKIETRCGLEHARRHAVSRVFQYGNSA